MSRTRKEGKRFWRHIRMKPKESNLLEPVYSRRSWGSTEKILRRNRKLWTRLLAKRRRAHGKKACEAALG